MKFRLFLLLVVTLCAQFLTGGVVRATSQPRYAVAFSSTIGTKIAILGTDGKWSFDDIPDAYFGQGDVALITTVWSPDGHTGYFMRAAPDDGQVRYIYAFDLLTRTEKPVVYLDHSKAGVDFSEIEVSPDNRYLWVSRLDDDSSRVIDTQAAPENHVIVRDDGCPGEVMAWLPGKILVRGYLGCSGTLSVYDLKLHKASMVHKLTDAEDKQVYDSQVIILDVNQPFVLVFTNTLAKGLSKVSLETGAVTKLFDADWLLVSDDSKSAGFVANGHLFALDLLTLKASDLGAIGTVKSAFTAGDTFNYWLADPARNPQTIQRVTLKGGRRTEMTIYSGQSFDKISFAPGGEGFMLDLGKAAGYQLYDADGKLTWASQTENPDVRARLDFDVEYAVWANGWYHARLANTASEDDGHRRGFAINATTGKTIVAPDMGVDRSVSWLNASPDGAWWLYAAPILMDENPGDRKDNLLAYNVATGETVLLSEEPFDRNEHFSRSQMFVWSPVYQATP